MIWLATYLWLFGGLMIAAFVYSVDSQKRASLCWFIGLSWPVSLPRLLVYQIICDCYEKQKPAE